jgi:hypothetical protein
MVHAMQFVTLLAMTAVTDLRDDARRSNGIDLRLTNSHPVIWTRGIERVVACGPIALNPLVQEMRRPDVTLDTFFRCYSACDQILRKAGLPGSVGWYGGHVTLDDKTYRITDIFRIGGFDEKFRKEQIDEIVKQAKKLNIALTGGD